jgi:lipopolysaccharide transport system permease protein
MLVIPRVSRRARPGPPPSARRWLTKTYLQGWHLFWMLQTRRYRMTFLGYTWLLVKPLAMFVPILVVGKALNFADAERTHMPYSIYAVSGVMLWQVFSATATHMLSTSKQARKRARRLQLDPMAPVVLALLQTSMTIVISFVALLIVAAVERVPISAGVLLFPIPAAVTFAAAVAITLPLVLADAVYRDARRSWEFLSQLIFWSLPVVHLPPEGSLLATVVRWHPLTPCFELWRSVLIGDVTFRVGAFVAWSVAIGLACVLVARFFRHRFWESLDYVR